MQRKKPHLKLVRCLIDGTRSQSTAISLGLRCVLVQGLLCAHLNFLVEPLAALQALCALSAEGS